MGTAETSAAPSSRRFTRVRTVLVAVLHNRSLSRLQLAFLLMTTVEYGEWITLLVYAYARGGASAAGLVALAQLIPSMVIAPVLSARGGRLGVVRLLVVSHLASALMLAATAAAMLLSAPAVVAYAAAIAFTLTLGVSVPVHHVLMPLVVRHPDELTAANVASGWSKGAGALAGPLVAGVLIAIDGPGLACAGLAAACAFTPLLVNVHPLRAAASGAEEEGGLREVLAAARVIAGRPNTRALLAYRASSAAIEGAIDLLVVLLAVKILVIGQAAAGYLSAAFGAGGLVGAGTAVVLVGRRLALPLAAAALIAGISLGALSVASSALVAVVLLIAVGAARSVQSIAAQTLLQRSTPLQVIVCAFALIESIRDAGLAFGSLAVPALVALGGSDAAFIGIAALAPLVVLATLRRVRSIDRDASIPVVEMGVLRNLDIFAALPAAALETLAREAAYVAVPAGHELIREGDPGDRYYAITHGSVAVSKGPTEIRRMGRGEGFGEIALLHPVRRTATVTAVADTTLLSVRRDAFLTAVNESPGVHEAAGRIAGRLLAQAP